MPDLTAAPTVSIHTLASDMAAFVADAQCQKKLQALFDAEAPLSPLQSAILRTVLHVERLNLGDNPIDATFGPDVVVSANCKVRNPCGGEALTLRLPIQHAFAVKEVLELRKGQQQLAFPMYAKAVASTMADCGAFRLWRSLSQFS